MESDWLMLLTKWTICQLYHGENKLHIDEMLMMMSALFKINMLRW